MRIRVLKLIPLLLLVSTVHPVFSQQTFLHGNLTDSQTQEPIAFATIRVKNKSVGVVSNEDGGFQIPEALKAFGDTLEISSMGYVSIVLYATAQTFRCQ